MFGWTLQKKAYDPAVLKTIPPDAPAASCSVVHVGSSVTVAVWGALSLFVQTTTSPTPALTVAGSNANPAIAASTVPASVDGAHAAPPAALSDAAGSLAAGALAGGALAGGALAVVPPQAATISTAADPKASNILLDMWASSWFQARASSWGYADGYVGVDGVVS
jgi:hypothetical protein